VSPSLPSLSIAQLEILQQALNPLLNDPALSETSLNDASALLARLGIMDRSGERDLSELLNWLHAWRDAGGNDTTLSLVVDALLSQQRQREDSEGIELVWSGPDWGVGAQMRDQSVLIKQLVQQAERRLLLTTYAFYKGPFIEKLFELIKARMEEQPKLEVRLICNITRKKSDSSLPERVVAQFREKTWPKLWGLKGGVPSPSVFYDPRSVQLDATAVCHVKAVVADDQLLVTSANLTDAAQLHNFELGIRIANKSHADATWEHFEQLINRGLLLPLNSASADQEH